jgi:hypothetical protein
MGIFEVGKGRKPKEKILHRPTAMHGCGNGETNSRRKTGIWKEGRKEGRKDWGWDGCGTDRYASRQRKQYNVVLLFHTMSIDKKAFFI